MGFVFSPRRFVFPQYGLVDSRPRFACNVVVGILKMVLVFGPFEVDVEMTDVAVVSVLPLFAMVAVFEPPKAATEVVFGRFAADSSSRGCSKRPRSKDMIVN